MRKIFLKTFVHVDDAFAVIALYSCDSGDFVKLETHDDFTNYQISVFVDDDYVWSAWNACRDDVFRDQFSDWSDLCRETKGGSNDEISKILGWEV